MNNLFEIKLVTPKIWEPIVVNAFAGLSSEIGRKAHSILRTLHNRHIGITPGLAAGLASLVTVSHDYRAGISGGDIWEHVIKRLQDETSGRQQSFGVLLSALPPYSILRLAMPILEEACQRIHLCCLFCEDNIENDITRDDYTRYSHDLADEIKRMVESREDYFQLFWTDRAITLAAYSSQACLRERAAVDFPETDPPALGLLLRLKTRISKARPLSFHASPMSQPQKHREVRRIKEGGFSGIYITRRQEDMGDILLSEFVNPPVVLADRLINNGYLALRRQAKREKLRDVMVLGLMPAEVQPKLSVDFIKACWLDFISRFGMMLIRNRRVRSEFRWLEGDRFGGIRSCHFLLQDLAPGFIEIPVEGDWRPLFRREFLTALGWLPQYLDTRGIFKPVSEGDGKPEHQPLPEGVEQVRGGDLESAKQWAFAAWRSQKENLLWAFHEPDKPVLSPQQEKRLEIDRFAFVHLMLFLPAGKRHEGGVSMSGAARLGALSSGFGISNIPGRSVSVTWVPERINVSREWAFDCREKRDSLLFSGEKPVQEITGHYIAGRLVQAWRDYLLKELRNG
jgi:hypothetical protein